MPRARYNLVCFFAGFVSLGLRQQLLTNRLEFNLIILHLRPNLVLCFERLVWEQFASHKGLIRLGLGVANLASFCARSSLNLRFHHRRRSNGTTFLYETLRLLYESFGLASHNSTHGPQ